MVRKIELEKLQQMQLNQLLKRNMFPVVDLILEQCYLLILMMKTDLEQIVHFEQIP